MRKNPGRICQLTFSTVDKKLLTQDDKRPGQVNVPLILNILLSVCLGIETKDFYHLCSPNF